MRFCCILSLDQPYFLSLLKTRKPSHEVKPTNLATLSADSKNSAVSYLFTVITSSVVIASLSVVTGASESEPSSSYYIAASFISAQVLSSTFRVMLVLIILIIIIIIIIIISWNGLL